MSLATRLAVWFAIGLVFLCAVIAFVVDNAVLRGLEGDRELALATEVRRLREVVEGAPDPTRALQDHVRRRAEARVEPRLALRIRSEPPLGGVIAEDPEAGRLLGGLAPAVSDADVESQGWTLRRDVLTDRAGRAYAVELLIRNGELERFLARFRTNLVLLVTPLFLSGVFAGRYLIRRALSPLERVTAAAARIGSKTLGERLEVRRSPQEIARLAETFNGMLDRLEDAFRRLEDFGADLAHELRTPLQNLRGEAEVALLRPRSQDEYREILGELIEECDRLARIVDDVLLLSRVERHEEALDRAPFDLAAEIDEIVEFFEDFARTRGVDLRASREGPLDVRGDRVKLRRAIANLVDNAIKYTERGGRVTIEARRAPSAGDRAVEVLVSDTGCGIPPAHLPKVFERFYRVEKSRSREFGGSGLGLGIARTIARAHGGDLILESEVEKGTRARLRVPV